MRGFGFFSRHLLTAGLALAVAAIAAEPAAAQQRYRSHYFEGDRYIYYNDGRIIVSVPASRVARNAYTTRGGVASGPIRRYTVGGNRTSTTRTQSWHVGERGIGRHGSAGRTTGRTGTQSPFRR
jgi:hypothetical protein